MNEDNFNMEIRKFLKKVGITSQREIGHAVEQAIADGKLSSHVFIDASLVYACSQRACLASALYSHPGLWF